jgi:hypothetical protein
MATNLDKQRLIDGRRNWEIQPPLVGLASKA